MFKSGVSADDLDPHQQQMGKHLARYTEHCYTTVVVTVLTVHFLLPDRDNQSRQHATHGSWPHPPVLSSSALILQTPATFSSLNFPMASLTSSMEGAVLSMSGSASSICNPAVQSCQLGGFTMNSCSRYSAQQPICPSAFHTRQTSAVWIALT